MTMSALAQARQSKGLPRCPHCGETLLYVERSEQVKCGSTKTSRNVKER